MVEAATHSSVSTFRLPQWWRMLLTVTPITLALIAVGFAVVFGDYVAAVLFVGVALFSAWTHHLASHIEVSGQGVRVYRLWWIPWQSVMAVKCESFFGLPYFRVKRRRALPVWIPLYYNGEGDLKQAIASAAPSGHPFSRAAKLGGWHVV